MAKQKRVWFKPLKLASNMERLRAIANNKPVEASEHFLVPCTWQGWIITVIVGGLAYSAARLALHFYMIKPQYGLAGWLGFAVIIIAFMHIANTFSNRS